MMRVMGVRNKNRYWRSGNEVGWYNRL